MHARLRHLAAGLAIGVACCAAAAFDLQGHRGARGLAPENTLAAFERALDLGVTTLELDIHLTRDGVPLITHDPRPNPAITRDAQGQWIAEGQPLFKDLTLAQAQAYDVGRLKPGSRYADGFPAQQPADGQRMPTLEALFARVQARGDTQVRFNIEIKSTPDEPPLTPPLADVVRATLDVIRRHGMAARVGLQSFDWRVLREVKAQAPEMALSALTTRRNLDDGRWTAGLALDAHGQSVPRMVKAIGAQVWSPFWRDLTPDSLAEARTLGLKVIPWTVNDAAAIDQLLGWGVDGLISDHPERVRETMAARAMALPPPGRR